VIVAPSLPTTTLDRPDQADARAVVSSLAPTSPRIGGDMATHLHDRIPELGAFADQPALLGSTEASCTANVSQIIAMLAAGASPTELKVPEPALDYARGLVQRRTPLAVLLRAYRVGHAYFWNIVSPLLTAEVSDDQVLVSSIEASSNFMFEYIDLMSGELVDAYHVERDRWVRSAAAVRAETARQIIDGKLDDERVGSSRLAYELRRHHVALILAGEPGEHGGSLEREAVEVGAMLGCADPLLVPAGAGVLWAWCGTFKNPTPAALARIESHRPPDGVRIAVGRPAYGIDGFRFTHVEAGHAARFWEFGGSYSGGTTSYRSVEVVSLMASDIERARRFVNIQLGPLAEHSEGAARMRSTLLGFLAHGCSHVRAAQELHMHQNTVYNRVRRAEELLGGPVADRRVELQTALMLAETLGDSVLNGH
jgi:hypothetical protein